jgi:photosystem II stability/assembly factor-like uncharacterized protein
MPNYLAQNRAVAKQMALDKQLMPQVQNAAFNGIAFAWIVTPSGELLRTENEGATWEKITGGAVSGFERVSFIDGRQGWAINKIGQVWRTFDSGRTWDKIAALSYGATPIVGSIGELQFVDELHGWVTGPFSIWRTEDGGLTWQSYSPSAGLDSSEGLVHGCYFISAQKGWLGGMDRIYATEDGGRTWQQKLVPSKGMLFRNVFLIDEYRGWVNSYHSKEVYQTNDGGKTWYQLSFSLPGEYWSIRSIHFINKDKGWAVGHGSDVSIEEHSGGIVLYTVDGGQNWQLVLMKVAELFYSRVYFIDAQHGWLIGRDNVYRTNDGGQTWRIVLSFPPILKSN